MPCYVYRCHACGTQHLVEHGMKEEPSVLCLHDDMNDEPLGRIDVQRRGCLPNSACFCIAHYTERVLQPTAFFTHGEGFYARGRV